jgi:ClpP class serine protease
MNAPLRANLFNRPLLLDPRSDVVVAALADVQPAELFTAHRRIMASLDGAMLDDAEQPQSPMPYEVVSGVAMIMIRGVLVQRLPGLMGMFAEFLGLATYEGIRRSFILALFDESVEAIALVIDSPGGDVSGLFDLADLIYRSRGAKPIWAILDENAFSAAYLIASAADEITVPRTGGTGHVGAIYIHLDISRQMDAAGVTPTLITFGAHKADGNPAIPLSRDAQARMQMDIDQVGEMFVAAVARNRDLGANAVRRTQAQTYLGARGVDVGFADAVMAPDEALRALLEQLG